ncbi:MAG TPA: tetratricopeptide repeat protein, partial [Humisphaera sp.]|nr:tetratricopeptide repeat protein [Humisphaera sp.]
DIENGQLELAEQELKLARHYRPADPEPYYLSGVVYQRWQKPDVAYDFYHQAATKAPAELAYLLAQAEMLVAMDRSPEALQMLASRVTYFEHSGAIRDAVGQLLVQAGRYHEAAAMFREASILSEEDAGVRERLALAQYQDKNYREASDILVRLVQTEAFSKRTDLFTVLGECQLALGKSREARYSFESASQLDQYDPHIWQCLGRASLEVADYHRAELSLKRALKLDPAAGESHLLLGFTYLHQNNAQQALDEFQKASSLDSRDTVSMCMVGYALQKLGKSEEAAQYYARALHLKPGDEMARTLMADVDLK